jgi:hypothetical protein
MYSYLLENINFLKALGFIPKYVVEYFLEKEPDLSKELDSILTGFEYDALKAAKDFLNVKVDVKKICAEAKSQRASRRKEQEILNEREFKRVELSKRVRETDLQYVELDSFSSGPSTPVRQVFNTPPPTPKQKANFRKIIDKMRNHQYESLKDKEFILEQIAMLEQIY